MLRPDIPIMNSNLNETTRQETLAQLKQAKAGRVWIALDRASLFDRKDHIERLRENLRFFEQNGFEIGVWIQVFGFGDPLPHVQCDWTRIRSVTGVTREADAFCPEDPNFTAAFLNWVRDIAACAPKLMMLDDDLCLSVRPGIGCFCDRHLKLLQAQVGKIDDLTSIFTGGKNKYRDAWYQTVGNSMREFCQKVRRAVDEIDPAIRVGLCAGYTSWDIEGTDPIEMAKLLAGSTKPFFRLTGAPYWVAAKKRRFPGQRLSAVAENARNQIAWCAGEEIEIFAEADSYPRPCHEVPAMLIENFDIAMHASGIKSLKYICDYYSSPAYETQYLKIHTRNLPLYEKIEAAFKDTTPCGIQVYRPAHRIQNALLPDQFAGEKPIMNSYFSKAAALLSCHAIPVYYGEGAENAVVFGDDAQYFENVHKRVVLDLPAALLLQKRGIDVGIEAVTPAARPAFELFENERTLLSGIDEDAPFFDLTLKDGATVQSSYNTGCVASFRYKNFLILNFDTFALNEGCVLYCSYARGRQLQEFFGYPFPAVCGYAELYSICAEQKDRQVVLFQNQSIDPIFDFEIKLPRPCRSFRLTGAEGTLCENAIRISTTFAPQETLLLEVDY